MARLVDADDDEAERELYEAVADPKFVALERDQRRYRGAFTRRVSVYRVLARPTQWRLIMSDSAAMQPSTVVSMPVTLADVLGGVEPMGDLSVFVIDDLTVDEEDAFFATLEDA